MWRNGLTGFSPVDCFNGIWISQVALARDRASFDHHPTLDQALFHTLQAQRGLTSTGILIWG